MANAMDLNTPIPLEDVHACSFVPNHATVEQTPEDAEIFAFYALHCFSPFNICR
jgi:hypothetical protein